MKIKYPLPATQNWAFIQWSDIPKRGDKEKVYLRRLRVLQTPRFGVLLHWINDIDDGPYPHDHPWTWFRTFILRGGYLEDFYPTYSHFINDHPTYEAWGPWSTHKMTFTQGHQITYVRPHTLTLVIHGRRIRRFCFWTKDRGKVRYDVMAKMRKG